MRADGVAQVLQSPLGVTCSTTFEIRDLDGGESAEGLAPRDIDPPPMRRPIAEGQVLPFACAVGSGLAFCPHVPLAQDLASLIGPCQFVDVVKQGVQAGTGERRQKARPDPTAQAKGKT